VQYKTYTLYPEYVIREKDAVGLTKWALSTLRMQKLDQLRTALQNGHVREEEHKHFVSLPTVEAHSGHATGIQAGFSQGVNPAVIAKITELVGSGITDPNEVRCILRHFVNTTLSKELGIKPYANDRAFFPQVHQISTTMFTMPRKLSNCRN